MTKMASGWGFSGGPFEVWHSFADGGRMGNVEIKTVRSVK